MYNRVGAIQILSKNVTHSFDIFDSNLQVTPQAVNAFSV